jgi:membrane protease subunit (stomatin/prohibitin family)
MLRRRRPLMRAAMVGGTAYVAGRAGAKHGAAAAQDQAAEAAPAPAAYAPPAAAPAPSSEDTYAQLEKLKKLLDDGVLTQPEFDAQKQKLLQAL